MQSRRGKAATASERRRFQIIASEVGCVCCRTEGHFRPAEVNHLLNGYRIGHAATVPECEWHHRGIFPAPFTSAKAAELVLGPSRARNKRAFHRRYGTDKELLSLTNVLVDRFEATTVGARHGDE
jgi:hypothetical protein